MKNSIFLLLLIPFIVNANEIGSNIESTYNDLLALKKDGTDTSRVLKEVPTEIKIEILNSIDIDIQNSGDDEIIDLRSLETDLRASIHDTIGSRN